MSSPFVRLAIVNRGEAAVRAIHAARELALESGRPLRTIVLYTQPDRHALFVREADEALDLGASSFMDAQGQRQKRYLDLEALERALRDSRAEAAWVGWGFVAERPEFADLCARMGVVFVGPPAAVMRTLGDKITAKRLAAEAGVPTVPWSGRAVATADEALAVAARLGYPVMVKATAGGGGRGIRLAASEEDLAASFAAARAEARRAFGDDRVFVEKVVTAARHVEVQVLADAHGTVWALGVRDCSIQRRNQKVIEESSSPVLRPDEERALCAAAVRLCRLSGYVGAGTVEFLFDARTREPWFIEVNSRLQVEHTVTEMTTGLDIVKLQLSVAAGARLQGEPPSPRGHAVEARLNAEDPENDFCPAPGIVQRLRFPLGPGMRVDTGYSEGDAIPAEFDSMIAKVIAWGPDRAAALARLRSALAGSTVVIRSGMCNKAFLLNLLARGEVHDGTADVRWLDRLAASGGPASSTGACLALLRAAIEGYEADVEVERAQFYSAAGRGRPRVEERAGRRIELRHSGHEYALEVRRLGPDDYQLRAGGKPIEVRVETRDRYPLRDRRGQGSEWRLSCGGDSFRTFTVAEGPACVVEIDGIPHRFSRGDQGIVRAPSPAMVVSVAVKPGDVVARGDRLLVLEAMKMETSVLAPFGGTVRAVRVIANVQVGAGAPLVVIEPHAAEAAPSTVPRLDVEALAPAATCSRPPLERLRCLLLGFDHDAGPEAIEAARAETPRGAAEVLAIFADLCALFRRGPLQGEVDGEEDARGSTEEYLFTYLRDLDAGGAALPQAFLERLRRALAHYGVESLERTPELEESLFRLFKAHQREGTLIPVVLALLERLLEAAEAEGPALGEDVRGLLVRLTAETQLRYPSVSDLAREARFRAYERPLLEQSRLRAYAAAEADVDALDGSLDGREREARIAALVHCPQPLAGLVLGRLEAASPSLRCTLLEVLVRRYYRIRQLHSFACREVGGYAFQSAVYDHRHCRYALLATHARAGQLGAALEAAAAAAAGLDADGRVLLDLFVSHEGPPDDAAIAERVSSAINRTAFSHVPERIAVLLARPDGREGRAPRVFTFRPGVGGYREDTFYRGVHPQVADRLGLERLANFRIERMPSPEDLYVIKGVALDNPRDERLFVVAEVRDVTPVRDGQGRVVELPEAERTFLEALAAIRSQQMRRPPERRFFWNAVMLHLRPPIELAPDEISGLVARLAPATDGLGLEGVAVCARIRQSPGGALRERTLTISRSAGNGIVTTVRPPLRGRVQTLSAYEQRVARLRSRGLVDPYEIVRMLAPGPRSRGGFPPGDFVEYELDGQRLVPIARRPGENEANVVVGVIRNVTALHPEGMTRVILAGDPGKELGSLAEPECRRIIAAIGLAEDMGAPLEWFALSAGARISMESGTENMDWIAGVLRRLVAFTQAGGEVNVIVNGINVGAQPYWNAEATMLMHTRGILVMMPESAMVLTGKRALDYSGGVSAEDNQGIGGYDRIMGPNGEAQYFARDLGEACQILLRHYERCYVAPGERFPRRAPTSDPVGRDVCAHAYGHADGNGFAVVGDIFSEEKNPGRKRPFDIRRVMAAVIDQDHPPLERWFGWQDAEMAVVWDARLGGCSVSLVGFESRPLPRLGFVPADGPDTWTAGTLFPQSSRKVARAINAASGVRPLVVLANLTGFDGSPESLRLWQLEYGAEIGRAIVNFQGPIVFCVVSRYHGGAFVVFSNALNDSLEVAALEGSYASVIGGAPAAAVVFSREVERRVAEDARIQALEADIARAEVPERARLRARQSELRRSVQSEMLGRVADEFDAVHSVERAHRVGSVHRIVPPARLRAYLVDAVERGMRRTLEREGSYAAV